MESIKVGTTVRWTGADGDTRYGIVRAIDSRAGALWTGSTRPALTVEINAQHTVIVALDERVSAVDAAVRS